MDAAQKPIGSINVIDLTPPPWAVALGTWIGTAIGAIFLTRSHAKKRLDEAIQAAESRLQTSNGSLLDSQIRELNQLREEVGSLRQSVAALSTLNERYVNAISEKELQRMELEGQLRHARERIHQLEADAK